MAVELSRLKAELTADTTGYVQAMGAAAAAADKAGKASDKLGESVQQSDTKIKGGVRGLEALKRQIDPTHASAEKLKNGIEQLNRVFGDGRNPEEHARLLALLHQRYDMAGQAAQRAAQQEAAAAASRAQAAAQAATEVAAAQAREAAALSNLRSRYDASYAAAVRYNAGLEEMARLERSGTMSTQALATAKAHLEATLNPVNIALAKEEQELRQLVAVLEPAAAATARLAQQQATLDAALARGSISAARHQELSAGLLRLNNAQDTVTKGSGRLNQALQQSGMQINDVAAQVASGGNVFQALGLQIGQLLQVFGVWGGVLGAGVAILGMYAAKMWDTSEATKKAKEAEEDWADALEMSKSIMETSEQTQKRLNEEKRQAAIETAKNTLKLREETEAIAEQEIVRARIALQTANDMRSRLGTGGLAQSAGVVDVGVQLAEQRIANMVDLTGNLTTSTNEAREALRRLLSPPDSWNNPDLERRAKEAAAEAERLRQLAEQEAKRRDDMLDKMGAEWDERTRLLEATKQGSEATRKLAVDLAGEQAIRQLLGVQTNEQAYILMHTNPLLEEQGKKARQLARDSQELTHAIQDETDAQKKRADTSKRAAQDMEREAERLQQEINRTAERMASDVAENLYDSLMDPDRATSVVDFMKSLFRRIAVEAATAHIILPIMTQVVGGAPGMFGVGGSGPAANINSPGVLNSMSNMWSSVTGSGYGSQMALGSGASGTGIAASINSFGTSAFGMAPGTAMAAPSAAFVGPMPMATGTSSMLGGSTLTAGLGAGIGGAAIGGMVGSMIGNATGSRAIGAGSGALTGAAAGFMMGGPVGAAVGAIGGALMGALGTEGKKSNKEGNAAYDMATGRTRVGGQEGDKASQENRDAASRTAQSFGQIGSMLGDFSDRRLGSSIRVVMGDRDGMTASIGDQTIRFKKRNEDAMRDMTKWAVTTFANQLGEDLPRDVQTALKKIDWKDVTTALEDIAFAGEFTDTLKALRGDFGLTDEAAKAAKDEIRTLTDGINEFRANTARLGLDTASANDSTRSYVEGLIGLRQVAEPLSEVRQGIETARVRFDAMVPLLRLVGIATDEAGKAFQRFMATVRGDFMAGIERAIAEITGDPTYAFQDLVTAQRQRLGDAIAIGGDLARVERLNALERQAFLERLTTEQRAQLGGLVGEAERLSLVIVAVKSEMLDLIEVQTKMTEDAAKAARAAAAAYRQLSEAMADAIRELRGGDLSTLTPAQQLAEKRANFQAVAGRARAGDQDALAELPRIANVFLQASREYNASSDAYSADFAEVMAVLASAGAKSDQMAETLDNTAALMDEQVRLLGLIKDAVSSGNLEAASQHLATLNLFQQQHAAELGSLGSLLGGQTGEIASGNARLASLLQQFLQSSVAQREEERRQSEAARVAAEAAAKAAAAEAAARAAAEARAAEEARARAAEAARFQAAGTAAKNATLQSIGGASNAEFVNNLYKTMVGRDPDAAGFQHHMNLLNRGTSRQYMLDFFRNNAPEVQMYLEGLRGQVRSLGGIPAFATGGYHRGGLRLVGEHGPELESTGPSRVWSAPQTRSLLKDDGTGRETVAELRALRDQQNREAQALRQTVKELVAANDDLGRQVKKLASGLSSAGGRG